MREVSNGCLLTVKVKLKQPKFIVSYQPTTNEVSVSLTKPAVDGKANAELVNAFRRAFGSCEIKSGMTQSRKIVFVSASIQQVQEWVQNQS